MVATPDMVRAITGSTLTDGQIQPFLDASACFLSNISECIESLTSECADQADAYLASHLLTSSAVGQDANLIARESLAGKYSIEYLSPKASGEGVLSTSYGHAANALTNGCLADLDRKAVNLYTLGSV